MTINDKTIRNKNGKCLLLYPIGSNYPFSTYYPMSTLHKFSTWFYRITNGWLILIFLFIQIGFNAFVFPASQTKMGKGVAVDVLDLQFGFSNSQAFGILDKMGVEGREIYKATELLVDGIYPIVYTLFLVFLLSLLLKKKMFTNKNWALINLFPLVILLFDYCENTGIISLINQFPTLSDATVSYASVSNMAKWGTFGVAIGLVIWGGISLLFKQRS